MVAYQLMYRNFLSIFFCLFNIIIIIIYYLIVEIQTGSDLLYHDAL